MEAKRVIARTPTAVYAFLADLDNHKLLANQRLAVADLDAGSGRGSIQLHGPLGISRTAQTTITERRPARCWGGTAQLETGTRAEVRWHIKPHPDGTLVGVTVDVRRTSIADRTLLTLGGRQWIRRGLEEALDRLVTALGYMPAAELRAVG